MIHQPFQRGDVDRAHLGHREQISHHSDEVCGLVLHWLVHVQTLTPSLRSTWSAPVRRTEIIKGVRDFGKPGDRSEQSLGTHVPAFPLSLFLSLQEHAVIHKSLFLAGTGLSWKSGGQNSHPQPMLISYLKGTHPLNLHFIQAVRSSGWQVGRPSSNQI